MRAGGGAFMQRAGCVAVHRDLLQAAPHDGAAVARDLVGRSYVPRREPVGVLRRHVEVFARELARGHHRHARRRVDLLPRVLAAEDQVAEQHPGDRAVRQAHAGVAGGDEDVVVVHRVVADEGEEVRRLHHLAAPHEFDVLHRREALSRPSLELSIALR